MATKTPEDKALERAKIELMMDPNNIFWVSILLSMRSVWRDDISTAGVDGRHLFINPKFFLSLNEKERVGVLMHEVSHIARNHITRRNDRNHRLFNEAGDYLINAQLISQGYSLPDGCLHNPDYTDTDFNTETLYKVLEAEQQNDPNKIPGNYTLNGDIQFPADPATNSQIEQEIGDIILRATTQAKNSSKGMGSVPGEALVALDKIINPKLPWNVILQNFMTKFAKHDYSWTKPNRRYMPNFYLPSMYSEGICNLAIAVDSSGSVSDEEFGYFIGEIAMVRERLKPELISLVDFDTSIKKVQKITEGTDIFKDLKFHGRGGTNIFPVLDWAKENQPEVLIVFSDGEFSLPKLEHDPGCPVVWMIHEDPDFQVPFGEVIHYII